MKTLLSLLLAFLVTLTPAPAQEWDYCSPPAIELPAIPPCAAEKSRDIDAVVACVTAFWQRIADARVKACTDGTAARVKLESDIKDAIDWYTAELRAIQDEYFECVRNCNGVGSCIQACDAHRQVQKAAANQEYSSRIATANQEHTSKMAAVELEFYNEVAGAQADFATCIDETAPCK